jgi:hypothetical protein
MKPDSSVLVLSYVVSLSSLENRDYGRRGSARTDHMAPLYLQKLALTSLTSGGRSISIATELVS